MLRSLYDLVLRAAAYRLAMWWLGVIAFFESSVFPIRDAMLIPMVVANREKVWIAATVCTIFSVIGACSATPSGCSSSKPSASHPEPLRLSR